MLPASLFQWWYGHGWTSAVSHAKQRVLRAYRLFSIPILLRTLFAPWRRIITAPGAGLDAHIRATIDNFVSRFIGSIVRTCVLIYAVILIVSSGIVSFFEIIAWPFIPFVVVALLIGGIFL
ncbi:hypothetical protein BH23PAT2_BH23PAT2_05370 [soil metagenome]